MNGEERITQLLEDLTGRPARMHAEAIGSLMVAKVRDNRPAARAARERLSEVTRDTMGAAEVLGARATLDAVMATTTQMAQALPPVMFGRDQSVLPSVTFEEGLTELATRVPATIRNPAARTAQAIAKLYSEGRHIAFVRSAEESVTKAAQQFLQRAMAEGMTENAAGRGLSMTVDAVRDATKPWSQAYSRLVFRNNLNTAITAGKFRQAQDPDIRAILPAFRFDAVGDVDTRHNHQAANGLIMSVDDTRWAQLAPPLGHNCRCQVVAVDAGTLDDQGMLDQSGELRRMSKPALAGPDEGFRHGGRPDLLGVR